MSPEILDTVNLGCISTGAIGPYIFDWLLFHDGVASADLKRPLCDDTTVINICAKLKAGHNLLESTEMPSTIQCKMALWRDQLCLFWLVQLMVSCKFR